MTAPWCITGVPVLGLSSLVHSTLRWRLVAAVVVVRALAAPLEAHGQFPSIDPTGQRIFAWPTTPFRPEPGSISYRNTTRLSISPARDQRPVGSEVVMLAAVCGQAGYLMANERVEWMLAPGGVGQFVALGDRYALDWLQGISGWPRKLDNSLAIGTTSSRYVTLTRGTPSQIDDVQVLRGQAWITVTSPVEGASYVTAYAPTVYGWDSRQQTAVIHWFDAQWVFPSPANNPVGSTRPLTTRVTRRSSGAPLAGWLVRYEVAAGPAAGFAPGGEGAVEVVTNAQGEATAELLQQQPTAGANSVSIRVIRPAEQGGSFGQRMEVGNGGTTQTWVAAAGGPPAAIEPAPSPSLPVQPTPAPAIQPAPVPSPQAQAPAVANLQVSMQGPPQAVVGETITFSATVVNRGNATASGLVVVDRFDDGLEHAKLRSPIERPIDPLKPRDSLPIKVSLRVTKPGELCNVLEIVGEGGLKVSARACVTAVAAAAGAGSPADAGQRPLEKPTIAVKKTGPTRVGVGQEAEFLITVTNTGQVAATRLKVVDHYDVALEPRMASRGSTFEGPDLVWTVDTLPAGKSIGFRVRCEGLKPAARACNQVTVTSQDGAGGEAEACLEIAAAPQHGPPQQGPPSQTPQQPGPQPQGAQRPTSRSPPGLTVTAADLGDPIAIGRETTYEVRITNNSQAVDRQVTLVVAVPTQLTPLAVGTMGPARGTIEGQNVRFAPVPQISPGETLTYQIRAVAKSAGETRFQARLTSAAVSEAIVAEETTTVFAE